MELTPQKLAVSRQTMPPLLLIIYIRHAHSYKVYHCSVSTSDKLVVTQGLPLEVPYHCTMIAVNYFRIHNILRRNWESIASKVWRIKPIRPVELHLDHHKPQNQSGNNQVRALGLLIGTNLQCRWENNGVCWMLYFELTWLEINQQYSYACSLPCKLHMGHWETHRGQHHAVKKKLFRVLGPDISYHSDKKDSDTITLMAVFRQLYQSGDLAILASNSKSNLQSVSRKH